MLTLVVGEGRWLWQASELWRRGHFTFVAAAQLRNSLIRLQGVEILYSTRMVRAANLREINRLRRQVRLARSMQVCWLSGAVPRTDEGEGNG